MGYPDLTSVLSVGAAKTAEVSTSATKSVARVILDGVSGTPTQVTTSIIISVNDIKAGIVFVSGDVTLTTPSASGIINQLPLSVGQMSSFVLSQAPHVGVTLAGGTGVSISGAVTVSGITGLSRQVYMVNTSGSIAMFA